MTARALARCGILASTLLLGCNLAPVPSPAAPAVAVAAATDADDAVAASPPLQTVAAPEIVAPVDVWILNDTCAVTLLPAGTSRGFRVECALDEDFLLLLESVEFELEESTTGEPGGFRTGLPTEVPIESATRWRAGEVVFLRACAVLDDGSRSPWQMVRLRVSVSRPEIRKEATLGVFPATVRPAFSWSPVAGASGYHVEVFRGDENAAPVFALQVDEPKTRAGLEQPMRPGSYRVRVRGVGGTAPGEWSREHVFIVTLPPPEVIAPLDGEDLPTADVRISWWPGSRGACGFELEIVELDESGVERPPRSFPVLVDSSGSSDADGVVTFVVPGGLEPAKRFRARVREHADVDDDESTPRELRAWSASVTFTVRALPRDPFPVSLLAADPDHHLTSPAVSPDGFLLACVSTPRLASAADRQTSRRIELLELTSGPDGPSFRPLVGARVLFPGVQDVNGTVSHPAWGLSGDFEPLLLIAATICDPDMRNDAAVIPAGSSAPAGALFTVGRLAQQRQNLTPHLFRSPLLSPSVPLQLANARVYFEAQRLECPAAPETPVIGEIWSMRADGTDHRLHGLGHDPSISPDGSTLALVASGAGGPEIRLRPTSSPEAPGHTVAGGDNPLARLRGLGWSPDGEYLTFAESTGGEDVGDAGHGSAGNDGAFRIHVIDFRTGEATRLTGVGSGDIDPAFLVDPLAPGGFSGVVFSSSRDGLSRDLYRVAFTSSSRPGR